MNIKWSFGGLNGIYAVLSQNQILTNLCVFCAIFFGEKSALVLIFTLFKSLQEPESHCSSPPPSPPPSPPAPPAPQSWSRNKLKTAQSGERSAPKVISATIA